MIIVPPRPPLTPPLGPRDQAIGPPDAAISLVVFGDYQCPHCKAAHDAIWSMLQENNPPFRLAWRHFPLAKMHPLARHAAMAAQTAAALGKFWPMHNLLMARQPRLEINDLLEYARELGIDPEQMRHDIAEGIHAARLQEDLSSGVRSGVNSTPTLYLNGRRHNGTYTTDVLRQAMAMEILPADTTGGSP